jgi:RNA polymerase sigma-70 factor (ECF subfamily)
MLPTPDDLAVHAPFLRRLASRLLASPDLAEDAVQETLLVSLRRPPPEGAGARAWLAGVLKNVARNLRRSERRRDEHERRAAPRAAARPEEVRAREELRRRLVDAVLALPDPLRETVLLSYDQGLPPREVSRVTGAPVSTVHDRLRRAAALLRERLELEPATARAEDAERARERRSALAALVASLPPAPAAATGVGVAKAAAVAAVVLAGGVAVALATRERGSGAGVATPPAVATAAAGDAEDEAAAPSLGVAAGAPRAVGPSEKAGIPSEAPLLFGVVEDARTGAPVPGAGVLVFSFQTLRVLERRETGPDGRFACEDTRGRSGRFHVVVRHADYAPAVVPGATASRKPMGVRLAEAGWIVGRIATDGGGPSGTWRLRATRRIRALDAVDPAARDLVQLLPGSLRASAETEAEPGPFRLGPLEAGTYSVVLLIDGRPPLEIGGAMSHEAASGVELAPGATRDLGTISIPALQRLSLRVVDAETEGPIAGARFEAEHEMDAASTVATIPSRPTSDPGTYEIEGHQDRLSQELGRVRVSAPGYGPATVRFFVDDRVEARLARAAALRGEVRDDDGRPLAAAVVLVRRDLDRVVVAGVTSDADGRFEVAGLSSTERLEVVAVHPTTRTVHAIASLDLRPGETREVVLGGSAATGLVGTLRVEGVPVAGSLVSLDTPDGRRVQVLTGADGRFAFSGLEPGRHELFASTDEGGASAVVDVVRGERARADLALAGALAGRVEAFDLAGRPADRGLLAPPLTVHAHLATDDVPALAVQARVRDDGTFALALPPGGRWRLSVVGDGTVTLDPVVVEVPRPAGSAAVVVPATHDPRDATIVVRVLSAEDGRSLEDATYRGHHGNVSSVGTMSPGATIREEGAELGRYEYVVSHPEHVDAALSLEVTPTVRAVERDVRLERSDAVRVTGLSPISRARDAGLREGDLVVRYGATRVESFEGLRSAIEAAGGARKVALEVLRDGRSVTIEVPAGRLGVSVENARVPAR